MAAQQSFHQRVGALVECAVSRLGDGGAAVLRFAVGRPLRDRTGQNRIASRLHIGARRGLFRVGHGPTYGARPAAPAGCPPSRAHGRAARPAAGRQRSRRSAGQRGRRLRRARGSAELAPAGASQIRRSTSSLSASASSRLAIGRPPRSRMRRDWPSACLLPLDRPLPASHRGRRGGPEGRRLQRRRALGPGSISRPHPFAR